MTKTPHVELEFSRKYDRSHSEQYLKKHHEGWARRLSHWRDEQVARHALRLADDPGLILDLPCGAGRFWPLLAEKPNRVIIGADNSASMLKVATAAQPADVVKRVRPLQTSAFDIDLPDKAADILFQHPSVVFGLLLGLAQHILVILENHERSQAEHQKIGNESAKPDEAPERPVKIHCAACGQTSSQSPRANSPMA